MGELIYLHSCQDVPRETRQALCRRVRQDNIPAVINSDNATVHRAEDVLHVFIDQNHLSIELCILDSYRSLICDCGKKFDVFNKVRIPRKFLTQHNEAYELIFGEHWQHEVTAKLNQMCHCSMSVVSIP